MKKMLIVMCMIGLVASCAWAYPGPNSFGVYLDTESTAYPVCADVAAFAQQTVWCCVTNPTGFQVAGWEAMVTITNDSAFFGDWELVSGLNVGSGNQFVVGNGLEPLQINPQGVVPLMSITMVVVSVDDPIEFYIEGVPGSLSFPDGPGYAEEVGAAIPCVTSTGSQATPVFIINPVGGAGECTLVPNEDSSWGAVKTLYK